MTGLDRVRAVMAGHAVDRTPVFPIVHSGLAPLLGVTPAEFATSARAMADVIVGGYRAFGFDGVQLSLGVIGEAEALGAETALGRDGVPVLRQRLLADLGALDGLRPLDPTSGGRMPMFYEAVSRVVDEIGREAFVLPTMRGPLLMASQLRGVEQILMDAMDRPQEVAKALELASDVALALGKWLLGAGAHALVLGEATCSPNFISPSLYRELVQPRHQRLIAGLKAAGWQSVGLHICGDISPIAEDIVATGVTFVDVDYQVSVERALDLFGDRVALRGNLDPSSILRFGTPELVREAAGAVLEATQGRRWILGSGCDVPAGTPRENLLALATETDARAP